MKAAELEANLKTAVAKVNLLVFISDLFVYTESAPARPSLA